MHRLALALMLCLGCGAEMRYHVDDTAIQSASVGERQGVMEAEGELHQAQAEQQKAGQDLQQAQGMEIASKKEAEAAAKGAEDADAAQKTAEQTHDVNTMNTANRNKVVAEAAQRALEA